MLFGGRQGYRSHHCPRHRRPDKQPRLDSPTLTLPADLSPSISAATWPDVDVGISKVCFLCFVAVIWHTFSVWELLSVFLHRAADWQNIVPRRNCCLIYCLLSESWRYTHVLKILITTIFFYCYEIDILSNSNKIRSDILFIAYIPIM